MAQIKWAHLSEGEMGEGFHELRCSVCGSRLPDDLAWFPRDVDADEALRLIKMAQGLDAPKDPESLVFCSDCKSGVAEMSFTGIG